MSFREESALLARELSHLAVTGSSRMLDATGLDVAVAARRETLELLRTVLADTTGISRNPTGVAAATGSPRRSVEGLQAHPVAVLAETLAAHPSPRLHEALSGHIETSAVGGAREAWSRVARHAVLAGHEWSTRPSRPSPEQQWSAVADVAAVARTVAVLDWDLAEVAHRLPDVEPALVDALASSTTSGLRAAAQEVSALAATGPLPEWGEPGSERGPTRVLMVRSPADVAAAQARVAVQVDAASELSPQAVRLVAMGQVRVLAAAAAALGTVDPERAARAGQLAQHLTASVAGRHQLAALMSDDLRPVAQTREIVQRVASVGAHGWNHPSARSFLPALAAAVDRSPAVVHALSRRADEAVRTGKWLVPNVDAERAGDLLWRRAGRGDPEPKLCAALSAVAARASAFTPPAPPARSGPSFPAPRETLAGELGSVRRARPTRPGQRPGSDVGRD